MSQLWHDLRAKNVGGSEVAALFGECPYLTRYALWLYKAGKLTPPDLSSDERIQAGTFMEPGIIQWANFKWKTSFQPARVYVKHSNVIGMGCTPDGVDYSQGKPLYAQVKSVDRMEFNAKWTATGDTITHAPLHIMLQVQHEMECTNSDELWLFVAVGGNKLYRMLCKRDHEVAGMLCAAVAAFWQSIRDEQTPEPDFLKDDETIKAFSRTLPVVPELELVGEYAEELAKEWIRTRALRADYEDKFRAADAALDHLVGNAQTVKAGEVTFRRTKAGYFKADTTAAVF